MPGSHLFQFNNLEDNHRIRVPILYAVSVARSLDSLIPLNESAEHGFENRIHARLPKECSALDNCAQLLGFTLEFVCLLRRGERQDDWLSREHVIRAPLCVR